MKQFAKKQFVWKRAKGGSCCQKQGVMCFFGDRLELLSFTKVCCFAAGRSQSHVADARPIGGSRVCLKAVKGCGSASAEYSQLPEMPDLKRASRSSSPSSSITHARASAYKQPHLRDAVTHRLPLHPFQTTTIISTIYRSRWETSSSKILRTRCCLTGSKCHPRYQTQILWKAQEPMVAMNIRL